MYMVTGRSVPDMLFRFSVPGQRLCPGQKGIPLFSYPFSNGHHSEIGLPAD